MMLEPAMSRLLKQVPSRYMLVNVVAHRARQIASKAEDEGISLEEKPVTIALHEVADGVPEGTLAAETGEDRPAEDE